MAEDAIASLSKLILYQAVWQRFKTPKAKASPDSNLWASIGTRCNFSLMININSRDRWNHRCVVTKSKRNSIARIYYPRTVVDSVSPSFDRSTRDMYRYAKVRATFDLQKEQ